MFINKLMKNGLLAAAFVGLVASASQSRADRLDGPNPPVQAEAVVWKPPGVGRDGDRGRHRVEARKHYRAVCWACSYHRPGYVPVRDHRPGTPWYGPARDNRLAALEDARRHNREHRGHRANVEVVVVNQPPRTPQHPGPRHDPVRPFLSPGR